MKTDPLNSSIKSEVWHENKCHEALSPPMVVHHPCRPPSQNTAPAKKILKHTFFWDTLYVKLT